MATPETLVGDLTEAELLHRVLARIGASQALVGPGDDAAVLAVDGGRVVVTTDTLVHGPDFRLAWSSGDDLGFKAAAVNLADVAAMGARPIALVVALAIPPAIPVATIDRLADGFREACETLAPSCRVEGGDLTSSDTLTIAVTAIGDLGAGHPVLRSGARPGDVVAVLGTLGAAGRGLRTLFARFRDAEGTPIPIGRENLTAAESADLAAQLRPTPPIASGVTAREGGATAMMDVSDGLVLDATRLADASDVTLAIDAELDADELAGGEDHALLATFPPDLPLPDGFVRIGAVAPRGAHPVLIGGAPWTGRGGWDPYQEWDGGTG